MNQISKNGKKNNNPYSATTTTAKTGLIIAIIATLLALSSMMITAWNWTTILRLHHHSQSNEDKINQALLTNNTRSDTLLTELNHQIKQQTAQQQALQSQVDQLVTLTNSSSQLQKKQRIIALLQTADLQLSFTRNVTLASQLLKKANTQLKSLSLSNQKTLEGQLTQLMASVDKIKPLETNKTLLNINKLYNNIQQLTFHPESPKPQPSSLPTSTHNNTLSWSSVWDNIKSLITVQHFNKPLKPIVTQSQQQSLQQYLLLQVAQAQWATINHNHDIFQLSLKTIQRSLKILVISSAQRESITQQLTTLASKPVNITIPNLDESINQLINQLSDLPDLAPTKAPVLTPPPSTTSKKVNASKKPSPVEKQATPPPSSQKHNPGIEV